MLHHICGNWRKSLLFSLALLLTFSLSVTAQDGYIGARSFAESQGIAYQWFPIQKILVMRKGLKSVKLTVNETIAYVDDVEVPMPAPARIVDGQIMVPATAMTRFFQMNSGNQPATHTPPPQQPPVEISPDTEASEMTPVAETPAPVAKPQILMESEEEEEEAVLVALRHSSRDDHTRIVLEFSEQVTYRSEFKDGLYRLNIMGCRNLIPTKRTNPVGRDIAKLDINSGPDRKGLVLSFQLNQKVKQPTVETVGSPFRMIIIFTAPEGTLVATPTLALQASAPASLAQAVAPKAPVTPKMESAPEIVIDVPAAQLSNPSFAGRTIVIDPGHGGSDNGFVYPGRPDEKTITLAIAQNLKASLEATGFKAVLTRSNDSEMNHQQRIAFANRNGGDLYISIHVGGSNDSSKAGFAVFSYSKEGTSVEEKAQGLSNSAIYNEWLKNTRFDLGSFLARKVNDRLNQHLKAENRGVKELPVLPLKFIMNPAIIVETGMLSDKTEGKNLISDNYRKAIAQSITNAVVDFFNGIVVNP